MRRTFIRAVAVCAALMSPPAAACGSETECAVEGGSYYVAAPEGWDGVTPLPTVIFFHGAFSSGRAVMRGPSRATFLDAGWLVIAPNGQSRAGRSGLFWPARDAGPDSRDDVAFARAVLDDAAERFPIDRERLLVSGFSAGGSMAWRLFCLEGGRFAPFYAPVAGALRVPTAAAENGCPGAPARLLHFHGFTDEQAPIEGRAIRDWEQGDVFASLALARAVNGCASRPDRLAAEGRFWLREWTSCASGRDVGLRLHPGGHGTPPGWVEETLDRLER